MEKLHQIIKNCRSAHIFRYASAYVVFAWATITLADTLGDNLGVPAWVETSLLLLWVSLFPVFLLFTWMKNKALVEESPAITLKAIDYFLVCTMILVLFVSIIIISRVDPPNIHDPRLAPEEPASTVSIGSKTFLESSLLLEIFALVIQDDHPEILVKRKHFIGETPYVLDELERKNIDLFGDYTGTILAKYLELDRHHQRDASWHEPSRLNQRLENDPVLRAIRVLNPLGFENNYALVMRRETAENWLVDSEGFTVSKLAEVSKRKDVRFGCTYGFANRKDGLPELIQFYDLDLDETVQILHDQKYEALDENRVDVIEGYTTDAQLTRGSQYVIILDDRGFWPHYEAIPVVRVAFAEANPEIIASVDRLRGQIKEDDIRWCLRELTTRGYSTSQIASGNFEPITNIAKEMLINRGLIR